MLVKIHRDENKLSEMNAISIFCRWNKTFIFERKKFIFQSKLKYDLHEMSGNFIYGVFFCKENEKILKKLYCKMKWNSYPDKKARKLQ